MQPLRARFTIWSLIVAVTLIGLAAWGKEMRRRSASYFAQVLHHSQEEQLYDKEIHSIFACGTWGGDTPEENLANQNFAAKSCQKRSEYHAAMKRKYDRAARYPWLSVDPDAPQPP
jgi:hypothetical protein